MLKGFLISLGLPPVLFLVLLVLGLAIARRWRRTGSGLVGLGLVGLVALSMPAVSGSMILALERDLPMTPPPNAMPEAIVILGGDLIRTTEPPFVAPGPLTLDRLRAGAALHRKTGLPILVTGGTIQPGRPAVATIMASSLREDFQVPVAWVEDRSTTTWENASFSADILGHQGLRSVYVVTQAWHMRRALLAFEHTGLTVTAAPTRMSPPADLILPDFIPHASSWGAAYYALHEWIGYAVYDLR